MTAAIERRFLVEQLPPELELGPDEPGWTNAELARSGRPPLPPHP